MGYCPSAVRSSIIVHIYTLGRRHSTRLYPVSTPSPRLTPSLVSHDVIEIEDEHQHNHTLPHTRTRTPHRGTAACSFGPRAFSSPAEADIQPFDHIRPPRAHLSLLISPNLSQSLPHILPPYQLWDSVGIGHPTHRFIPSPK